MNGVPAELDEAIAARRQALAQTADDVTAYGAAVELTELLLQRCQLTGEDPAEAIAVAGRLAGALLADSPARALPLLHLAAGHWARAAQGGAQSLRTSWELLRELRPLLDDDHPMHPEIRARAGVLASDIAVRLVDRDCAEEALADLDQALQRLADGPLQRAARFHRAVVCATRFRAMGGEDSDRRYAVDTFTEALEWPETDAALADRCHAEIVYLLLAEQLPPTERRPDSGDDQQVVECVRAAPATTLAALRTHLDAVSAPAAEVPELAAIRFTVIAAQGPETTQRDWDVLAGDADVLAARLDEHDPRRHQLVAIRAALSSDPRPAEPPDGLAELDEAIAAQRRKVVRAAEGQPLAADLLVISNLLHQRAELTGQDPGKSIEIAEALVALLDPPEQSAAVLQLALALFSRGSLPDLRRAAELLRGLREQHPEGSPERAKTCAHGGLVHAKLAATSGDPADVAEAIELLDAALADLPDGGLRRRAWIARASLHQLRFLEMGGTEEDHREATEAFTAALDWADAETRDLCHSALATLLLLRDVPADARRDPERIDPDDLVRYVDRERLAEAQRHVAEVPDAADEEAAAIRLLARSVGGDWREHDLGEVLRDLATAAGGELSATELAAIRSVGAALPECRDDEEVRRLLASASRDLPDGSLLHELFLLFRIDPDSPDSLGGDDLARLIDASEQRLETLPEGSPERAEELVALASMLVVKAHHGGDGAAGALARAKEIAEHVAQRYPGVETASGVSHALLALSAEYGVGHSLDTVQDALEHVRRADELLPPDDETRADVNTALGTMLMMRYLLSGNREDADAAVYYTPDIDERWSGFARWVREVASEPIADLDKGIEKLRASVAEPPPEHRVRWTARCAVALHLLAQLPFGSVPAPPSAADVDAARQALADAQRVPESSAERAGEVSGAALLCAAVGLAADDMTVADEGLAALDAVSRQPGLAKELQYFTVHLHGIARQVRAWRRSSADALNAAIEALERMVREHAAGLSEALTVNFDLLAANYEERGDLRRAVQTSLEALRTRARGVLLQSSPQRAMGVAGVAVGSAATAAQRCLRAGDLASAVQALELGRGMVLHAATSAATMPDRLRDGGHPDLAERWEAEVDQQQPWDAGTGRGDRTELRVPSDLRLAALRALEGTAAEHDLLSPPGVPTIGAALRSRGARALVYLTAGEAVVVTEDDDLHHLPLPGLRDRTPVRRFDLVQQERARIGGAAEQPWRAALHDLCGWAWTAAIGPLLDWLGGERPRVVLVPTGRLTTVPWHAAREPAQDGRSHHACQDAVFSYAASARQFVEAARRPVRPFAERPVLVRTPDLHWTRHEIGHLHAAHYAHGQYLGRPGRRSVPTPEDVLAALPDATLLHLGCHAEPAELPVDSALRLGAGRALPVREVLRRGSGPRGALVVLAACASDLTERQHDEVLTLATAFLAAGAGGVVGTKWAIDDLVTAMFMIVFHHHLNGDHPDPAEALRATQLWMLDPDRPTIPDAPAELVRYFAETDPTTPAHWAAFTYHGR